MSSETITRIDELERELARHAIAFRSSAEGSAERDEAIANYHRVLKSLMESEGWCGTPDLDSQLPDEFMPQSYKDYWSEAAQVSIDDLQGDLFKLGDGYVLRRGDFLSLPLYVMSGVLKENLAAHDRKASVEPRLPEAKYSFPPYEATATWLSRMRTDSNVAMAVVEQWWSHLSCFMGSVQLEHESTQLKFLALSRHTELVSAYCDFELKMDSAVLWRCLTAAQAFEQVHHSYREDPQCKEKREYYVGRLNNVWPAYAAAIHEADSLKRRIRNAIVLAHQTKHLANQRSERLTASKQDCATVFDTFLSHHAKDKPLARQLADALISRGLRPWLDERELVPGRPWQEALEEIIQTAKTAVVMFGPAALGPWEEPEMRACLSEFVKRKLPVIPVLLPEAPEQPELPLFLKAFTWVDLRAGLDDHGLDRLVWGITGQKPASVRSPAGSTPHPPVTIQSESGPLATWKEKLQYLQEQEAITADPAQRFALKKQIEEAQRKIEELG